MKKSLFFAGVAVALTACNPGGKTLAYTISGEVPAGSEAAMVYLVKNSSEFTAVDSIAVVDGSFKFEGTVNEELGSQLVLTDSSNPRQLGFAATFYYEPGNATVSFDENKRATVCGTPANDAKAAFNEKVNALGDDDEDGYYAAIVDAAKANTSNAFGLDQLYTACIYKIIDGQDALDLLAQFPANLKDSKKGESVAKTAEAAIKTAIGQPFIDFALASLETGEPLSLKSVVEKEGNKYVLLDFWASWCGPCMRELPYLLDAYAKYNAKGFEIFGCSLDRDADKWKEAVAEKKMNWVHVSDVKYWDCEGAAVYGVRSIPASFLIDCSNGTIIASGLRGDALVAKLAELLD